MQTTWRGIANKASSDKGHRFRNLFGLLTVGFLMGCWRFINPKAAAGLDRLTARDYGANLLDNLTNLVETVKAEAYRAKWVLRRYIPKLNGKLRPLGIPAIADKVLQLAVTKILEAIYEADFLSCSYGYRPRRGALDAVRDLSRTLQEETTLLWWKRTSKASSITSTMTNSWRCSRTGSTTDRFSA